MASERWNPETTVKFIKHFKTHECLWNRRSPDYKNKRAKAAAYQGLSDEMRIVDFGVDEVLRKIHSLRSTYCQERKRVDKSLRSGRGSVYVPSVPWYGEMESMFKGSSAMQRTMRSSTDSQMNDSYFSNDAHESGTEDVLNDTTERSLPVIKSEPKKKEIFRAIRDLKTLQGAINQELPGQTQKGDRFDVFGKSVAMQLRALSFERGMIGQTRIQNILSELLVENFKYNNMTNSTEGPMESF